MKWFKVSLLLVCAALLWASGIIPAIIPQAVPLANKIGNSTKFQLGATGAVSGDCATFDASLNITGPGTGAGCGGGGGTTVSMAPPYLTVSGTIYCGPFLQPCTIPPACSSGWTFTNQGGASCTTNANGDLFVNWAAANADQLRDMHRTPAATFTVVAGFISDYMPSANKGQFGVGLTVGDGTKFIHFEYANFEGQTALPTLRLQKWTDTSTPSTTYNAWDGNPGMTPKMGQMVWFKLVLDSTNLTWSYSIDGTNFTQFDQRAKGDFPGAITTVGVGAYNHTVGNQALISWTGA